MNVKGMGIKDIMNIDLDTFNKMNERELKQITSRLVSAGNKRIRRLKSKDINSPALRSLGEDDIFSVKLSKDMNKKQRVNAIRQEFAKIRNFLSAKTSTLKGYRQYSKKMVKEISEATGIAEKDINANRLFDALHKLQEMGKVDAQRGSKGSIQARNIIAEKLVEDPELSLDNLLDDVDEEYTAWYENKEQNDIDDETEEVEI